MNDLFANIAAPGEAVQPLGECAVLLRRFASPEAPALLAAVNTVAGRGAVPPHGDAGRLHDVGGDDQLRRRSAGSPTAPAIATTRSIPRPAALAARCRRFLRSRGARGGGGAGSQPSRPDGCLINRYAPGRPADAAPGPQRTRFRRADRLRIARSAGRVPVRRISAATDRPRRIRLHSGDVVVWGGPSRLAFHGVDTLADGEHALTGRCRINLTFRKAL